MMHARQCVEVRNQLEACHDGELPIDEQIAIQSHLGECVTCALAAAEIEELSQSFRHLASTHAAPAPLGLTQTVVERLGVEAQFSVVAQVRALFDDMHLVWAGLGATMATVICVIGSVGVLHAASQEQPDSLAALISLLANPGSNANPVTLDAEMTAPRGRSGALLEMSGEDAAFALAAVVTREGRIQNLEVLAAEYASALRVTPEVVLVMLSEASRAQFEPAQARVPVCRFKSQECGGPVAVNIVWLITSTTVKGRPDAEVVIVRRRWTSPAPIMGPAQTPPAREESSAPAAKPSAGAFDVQAA